MKVHHDIAEALDNRWMTTLILPDLSAAFGDIDYGILQKRMEYSFGAIAGERMVCAKLDTSIGEGR